MLSATPTQDGGAEYRLSRIPNTASQKQRTGIIKPTQVLGQASYKGKSGQIGK